MRFFVLSSILAIATMSVGIYVWRVAHTGEFGDEVGNHSLTVASEELLEVGGHLVTRADVEFEVNLSTHDVFESDELTPIPEIGQVSSNDLSTLRQHLTTNLVERFLLYEWLLRDQEFDDSDPNRYVECLSRWRELVRSQEVSVHIRSADDENRLKNRLCQQSLIEQYAEERIYIQIAVTDDDVKRYYEANRKQFQKPRRVVIRQIVTADEQDANRLRRQVNRWNFGALAKKHSITPEAEDEGQLPPFAKGDMPAVFDIAFLMRPGDISPVQKSTYGFHIILLEKKLNPVEVKFEDAASEIRERLTEQKRNEEYQKWVERALNTIRVSAPRRS